MKKVLFCNMPWGKADFPSIQLGILKSALERNHIPAEVLYANVDFCELLGRDVYSMLTLSSKYSFLLEWFFDGYLGGKQDGSMKEQLEEIGSLIDFDISTPFITKDYHASALTQEQKENEKLRNNKFDEFCIKIKNEIVPQFFTNLFSQNRFEQYDIVAFTCSFSQTIPSLSCAYLIKQRFPDKIIILGGNGMSGEAGAAYLKAFPWINYISQGEGEETLPELIQYLRKHHYRFENHYKPQGIVYRDLNGNVHTGEKQRPVPTENIPIPDYSDYFKQLKRIEAKSGGRLPKNTVLFETSRGCWWGEKKQCKFCGLNGENIHFRCKEPEQVLNELLTFSERYHAGNFVCVDNVLDYSFLEPLFDELIRRELKLDLFWEVKPTLKKPQLMKLARAGVKTVQAGIENFSTDILKLINKGSTKLQSICFIKNCGDAGIQVLYNYLYGFPQEKPEYYMDIVKIIPLLKHLIPPLYPPKPMILQKYSGYYKEKETDLIWDVQPMPQYSVLYSEYMTDVEKVAYNYSFKTNKMPDDLSYINHITSMIREWNETYNSSSRKVFLYECGVGFVNLYDTRFGALRLIRLCGISAFIFKFCTCVRSYDRIWNEIGQTEWSGCIRRQDMKKVLGVLIAENFLIEENEQVLSLANEINDILLRIPYDTRKAIESARQYNEFESLEELKELEIITVRRNEIEQQVQGIYV